MEIFEIVKQWRDTIDKEEEHRLEIKLIVKLIELESKLDACEGLETKRAALLETFNL